jgi:hypothetical protein
VSDDGEVDSEALMLAAVRKLQRIAAPTKTWLEARRADASENVATVVQARKAANKEVKEGAALAKEELRAELAAFGVSNETFERVYNQPISSLGSYIERYR